jgi:hypothetical protein
LLWLRSRPPPTEGLDIVDLFLHRARVRTAARYYGTVIAGLVVAASLGVACLGGLRLARGEANASITLLAGVLGLMTGALILRAKPELRTAAALAISAVGVALLGTEAFLAWRTFSGSNSPEVPNFDTRSVLQVVRDLQAKGTPAVPALLSSYARASGSALVPLGGMPEATTVFCNEAGQYVIYRSDADGFNNPPEVMHEVELVVLGDSFAHGQCVPQGMDVAGRLRAQARSARNLGCAGTGPLSALGALLEYGLAARPKTILWFYYEGNDPLDLEAYGRAHLSRVPDPGRSAVVDPVEITRSIVTLRRIRRLFALTNTFPAATPASLRRVLSVGVAKAHKIDAEIVFVYLPASARLTDARFADHRAEILPVAAKLGLRTIDFSETVSRHPDPSSLYPNRGRGHFDEDGYQLLTDTIVRCLTESSSADTPCH